MSDDDDDYDDDYSDEDKLKSPRCPYTEYYFEGKRHYQSRNIWAALACLNKALEMEPKDKRTLLERSKCYLYLGENDKAFDDVEAALAGNESDSDVLYQKAQVFYMMGKFEFAAVYFQRGMQLRPQMKKFKMGLQKALYAIQSALGGNTRIKLSRHQMESLREKHRQAVRTKKFKEMAAGGKLKKPVPPGPGFDVSPTPSMIHHVTPQDLANEEKQLLGLIAQDKIYCRNLVKNKDLYQVEKMRGRETAEVAESVVTFLNGRQEFWRQQKPINLTRTKEEIVAEVHLKLRRKGGIVANLPNILKRMEAKLSKLYQAESDNDWTQVVYLCQALQGILLPVSDALWPHKTQLLCNIFASMGKACIALGMYERGVNSLRESLALANKGNLDLAREKAMENLGNAYAQLAMYEKSIDIWRQWLKKCEDPTTKAKLLYEVGRCYLQLSDPLEARKNARQGINVARAAKNDVWQLINTVLVAECEVQLGSLKSSVGLMNQAVNTATKLDLGPITEMLEQVRDNVENLTNDANIELDNVQVTIFNISDEEKEGLFPQDIIDRLKSLKDWTPGRPLDEDNSSLKRTHASVVSRFSFGSSRDNEIFEHKKDRTPTDGREPLNSEWGSKVEDFIKEKGDLAFRKALKQKNLTQSPDI